jgi:AcrR family transcriptional regulator
MNRSFHVTFGSLMGRRPDPEAKTQLQAALGDYVLENGLADLSLRPLASALGTSPRMLLYHFESKERLTTTALEEVRRRQREKVETFLASDPEIEPGDLLRRFIPWFTSRSHAPFLRLFFEVYGLALREPGRFPGFLESAVQDWLSLFEDVLSRTTELDPPDRQIIATTVLAGLRGLLLDLLATGDRARVTKAGEVLLSALESHYERADASDAIRT